MFGNGGTFVILSVEEVRAKVVEFSLKKFCPLKKSGQKLWSLVSTVVEFSLKRSCPLKKSGQQS